MWYPVLPALQRKSQATSAELEESQKKRSPPKSTKTTPVKGLAIPKKPRGDEAMCGFQHAHLPIHIVDAHANLKVRIWTKCIEMDFTHSSRVDDVPYADA